MKDLAFILFSIFTLASGAGVVLARNPIYSAFSLILSFFGLAMLYLLWGAAFISMVQILIYAGAIVVLFVFVVMLLNLERSGDLMHNWLVIGITSVAAWICALLLLRTLALSPELPPVETGLDIKTLCKLLFTKYLWPFEMLTVFLVALIVGIYVVARPAKEELGNG